VHGERGDVRRGDNAPDGERGLELSPARFEMIAQQRGRQRRVDEASGDDVDPDRRSSSARLAPMAGTAAAATAAIARPGPGRRAPLPVMNTSVPPGRTFPAAYRPT
jgi:hypothetical protein